MFCSNSLPNDPGLWNEFSFEFGFEELLNLFEIDLLKLGMLLVPGYICCTLLNGTPCK